MYMYMYIRIYIYTYIYALQNLFFDLYGPRKPSFCRASEDRLLRSG